MKNNYNKNISDLKNANLKKDAVSSIYSRFLTYLSYLSVTEMSNTNYVSFPHASITPGNVVRGNQNYANEILTGASGHELQSVDILSTNLLSRYLQISKRENQQFGNVVPNNFHFYTRLIRKLHGKTSCQLLIWFLVWDKFIPLHLTRDKLN